MPFIRPAVLPLIITIFLLSASVVKSQIILSGTVYDSTKLYSISGVKVLSSNGTYTYTDSAGGYHINLSDQDSVSFYYAGRPTTKFPVRNIPNYTQFDISLKVRTKEHYKMLKEVRVFSNTHRQDSLENRQNYAKIFDYNKPTIRTDVTPGTNAVGFDLDEIIHLFRFRQNKQNLRFQKFMIEQEEEKYVSYRFNSLLIMKITGLRGDSLAIYKKFYKPSYTYVTKSSQLDFYQYIISSVAAFRKETLTKKDLYQ